MSRGSADKKINALDLVESTADAAFATDEEGRIVIWNKAAERLLGHRAEQVLGKACHDVLQGADVFGNRYCVENCNLCKMVRRKEPIRCFELSLRKASGTFLPAVFSVLTVRGPRPSQFNIIHLFQPRAERREADVLHQEIQARLDEAPGRTPPPRQEAPGRERPREDLALTGREIQVLRLLADGSATREIADSLYISVTTVRTHIQNILRKLDAHSKVQAVSMALRNRLV
ncbi:MAG: LuxR C-terminal-related transcriptional regulator [Acidobacteriota bacterium]